MRSPNRPTDSAARWTPGDLGIFVEQVRDDRFFALWLLAATTGFRLDVLTGLTRQDVDLAAGRISPSPAPGKEQSATARRAYVLDPTAHDALKEHVASWEMEREVLRQKTQKLFVWSNGEQVDPGSVRTMFMQHCSLAALPVLPLQKIREAHVVAALVSGIPLREISGRLARSVRPQALRTRPHAGTLAVGGAQPPTSRGGGWSCRSRNC